VSRIPVAVVERVEVVKGAQSTLYGTEAMGGVINIITRRPDAGTRSAALSVTAGTQGRRDATARVAGGLGDLTSSVDVSRRRTLTTPGLASDVGALAERLDGALKLRWSPDSARAVEASVLALDERQRWRSGTFYSFGDNVQLNARVGGTFAVGRHRFSPALMSSSWDHVARSSSRPLPIEGDAGDRQLQRVHQGEFLYGARFGSTALDLGTQVRIDEIETARVPGGLRSLTTVEPFGQLELTPTPRLTLLPGVRMSSSTRWGTNVAPRMAARWQPLERLTFRASVGDGFRAPDFKELFLFFQNTNAGYAVQGDPDLRPESSRSTMFGAELATANGFVRAQLFHNAFEDFIETRIISDPDAPPVYQYANVDDGSTRGLELEAGANLATVARLRVEGAYSRLATRDDATGQALLGRPEHTARLTLAGVLPLGLRASVTGLHTGRTPMTRDPDSGAISAWRDAFTRVDVRLARALPFTDRAAEIVLGADNLFDTRPAEWAGFTARHVYTSLSWSLASLTPTDR
jgi:outer membrane receptor for ferrienterochelin and colicins